MNPEASTDPSAPEEPSGVPGPSIGPIARDPREEARRLRALVHSFELLNSSLDLDTVLETTLATAASLLNARIASIALINDAGTHLEFVKSTDPNFAALKTLEVPIGEGVAGQVARSGHTEIVADMRSDPRFYQKIDEALGQTTESYICAALVVESKIIGTAQVMNRADGRPFEEEDARLLEGFARQAALAIQNARLHGLRLRQRAIQMEMELCAEIQSKLFPSRIPEFEGFELYGFSAPSREVGGDYYSFVPMADDALDAVIGDVSGKGISAAMVVSEFHTGYHILAQRGLPLNELSEKLNAHLVDSIVTGRFITAFAARLRPCYDRVEYVLAGHPSPFVMRGDGSVERLERTGIVFGLQRKPYGRGAFELRSGDLLVAFSDGYPEAANPAEELFEEERMLQTLRGYRDAPLDEIRLALDNAIDDFRGEQVLPDDRTLVLVRRL